MLTDKEKQAVKDWLRLDRKLKEKRCPFNEWVNRPCIHLCGRWFPNLVKSDLTRSTASCPCDKYELADVIKTARRMVRDAGK